MHLVWVTIGPTLLLGVTIDMAISELNGNLSKFEQSKRTCWQKQNLELLRFGLNVLQELVFFGKTMHKCLTEVFKCIWLSENLCDGFTTLYTLNSLNII